MPNSTIIHSWANHNNLRLNRAKCFELIFSETRRRRPFNPSPPLPDISCAIKILGVTITNKLSVSNHVSSLISFCAQSLHALRILRHQGMNCELQQTVYKAVIIAKLLYASCAWWGFTTAADCQRLESFFRRARRSGFYSDDQPTFALLAEDAERYRLPHSKILLPSSPSYPFTRPMMT